MAVDIETLERALDTCITHAEAIEGGLVLRNPWKVFDEAGIERSVVAELVRRGCLRGSGGLAFTIVRSTVAQRASCFLLVMDAENIVQTCRGAGATFDLQRVVAAAARIGTIGFNFAYANVAALSRDVREQLLIAGFHTVDCTMLHGAGGEKNVTDEFLQDLVRRFLDLDAVDGVILVTDDRGFAPTMRAVLDRGKRLIRISHRAESALDSIGEVVRINLKVPSAAVASAERSGTLATSDWAPERIIEDLNTMRTIVDPRECAAILRRMRLQAPIVVRYLRTFVRAYLGRVGRKGMSFASLLNFGAQRVRAEDRDMITRDVLHAFLSALIEIEFIFKKPIDVAGSMRSRYEPNWEHPFCVEAIADIPSQFEGASRAQQRAVQPPKLRVVSGSET